MTGSSSERVERYRRTLASRDAAIESLPALEATVIRDILRGSDVHQAAQEHGMSEAAIWSLLQRLADDVHGTTPPAHETAGLGSDTDPGVTGGYGETGFGSIGNEPPEPRPEEPPDER